MSASGVAWTGAMIGIAFGLRCSSTPVERFRECLATVPAASSLPVKHHAQSYTFCTAPGVDVERENAAAFERARGLDNRCVDYDYDALIVPGYVSPKSEEPVPGVDAIAVDRLFRAARMWNEGKAPFIIVSGGNVWPIDTPYNEAIEMKRLLISWNVPENAIFVEVCARHTPTNLRNAARLMRHLDYRRSAIVTSYDQAAYIGFSGLTGFSSRVRRSLGYSLGDLRPEGGHVVMFHPGPHVMVRGTDPLDP